MNRRQAASCNASSANLASGCSLRWEEARRSDASAARTQSPVAVHAPVMDHAGCGCRVGGVVGSGCPSAAAADVAAAAGTTARRAGRRSGRPAAALQRAVVAAVGRAVFIADASMEGIRCLP